MKKLILILIFVLLNFCAFSQVSKRRYFFVTEDIPYYPIQHVIETVTKRKFVHPREVFKASYNNTINNSNQLFLKELVKENIEIASITYGYNSEFYLEAIVDAIDTSMKFEAEFEKEYRNCSFYVVENLESKNKIAVGILFFRIKN